MYFQICDGISKQQVLLLKESANKEKIRLERKKEKIRSFAQPSTFPEFVA